MSAGGSLPADSPENMPRARPAPETAGGGVGFACAPAGNRRASAPYNWNPAIGAQAHPTIGIRPECDEALFAPGRPFAISDIAERRRRAPGGEAERAPR